MQRKLDWLALDPEKPDKHGNVYINMKFDDGTVAYKAGKPADMTQHYADLLGIQKSGELVEIELEDTGKKTQKGATKYKLVGYPGWSAPVAQGGKAQANARSNSTDESIARAVALKAAVRAYGHPDVRNMQQILGHADEFYAWLVRGEGQQDAEVPITERTTDPIPVPTSVSDGEAGADESEGVAVSLGGTSRAVTPEDNEEPDSSYDATDSPWAGMDVK